ncbi:MAG: hypothetical protein ABIY55_07090 [Kofleriaceae bacterium]
MARATWLLGATSAVGVALAFWLYQDNRTLRAELAARHEPAVAAAVAPPPSAELHTQAARSAAIPRATPRPALPDAPTESRLDRRARRTEELAQMFGRLDGESEDDYRSRVMPMIGAGLLVPRMKLEEARKVAQDKAHVTPEQAARLDKAFDKVYSDVLDYTNKAVLDGQLSPYERNVSGWLEYAGGLGGILTDVNGQVGKILDPGQIRTMADAGFEWGEYLGVKAPWEQLKPPPPRK